MAKPNTLNLCNYMSLITQSLSNANINSLTVASQLVGVVCFLLVYSQRHNQDAKLSDGLRRVAERFYISESPC